MTRLSQKAVDRLGRPSDIPIMRRRDLLAYQGYRPLPPTGDFVMFSAKMDSIEFTDSGAHGRIALFNYWLRCGNNEGLPLDVRHFARFKIYVFADFLLPMLSNTPGFFVGGCDVFIHKIRRISKGNPAPAYDIHGTFGGDPHELAAHFASCRIKG